MNQDIRQHLINIGGRAAHELERYVKIYDLKFDKTNFVDIYNAKMTRLDEILAVYDSMISDMEILSQNIVANTTEYDYCYSLGNYICEISNTIKTYQQRLRLIKYHQINGNRIKGILELLKNNREHKIHERAYLHHGVKLTALYGMVNNT
ncbi:MAG: hypothetical protein AB7T27_03865 [Kiritimatiellia bacterium]